MNRRKLLASSLPVIALAAPGLSAADQPKQGITRVEIEGILGSLTRQEGKGFVGASILAGGGELFLDTTRDKNAHRELGKLADKHLTNPGSSTFLAPRLQVKGTLEFRLAKVVSDKKADTASQGMWVVVVDSLTVKNSLLSGS